jgi:hypothetical protein
VRLAGPTANGWRVLNVVQSQEQFALPVIALTSTEPPTVTLPMPLKPDLWRQCCWFGPTSSSRRDRNSLRIGEVFDLL